LFECGSRQTAAKVELSGKGVDRLVSVHRPLEGLELGFRLQDRVPRGTADLGPQRAIARHGLAVRWRQRLPVADADERRGAIVDDEVQGGLRHVMVKE
jgi:hypothetical protein